MILQQDLVCIKHTLTFWRCSATTYSLGTPNIHSYNPSTMYHYRHIESLLRHFTANLHHKRFYSTITTPTHCTTTPAHCTTSPAQTLLRHCRHIPQLRHATLRLRHTVLPLLRHTVLQPKSVAIFILFSPDGDQCGR